jgi:hypothetical protein
MRTFNVGDEVFLWSVEGGSPQGKAPRYGSDEPDERSYRVTERILAQIYCVNLEESVIYAKASERRPFDSWVKTGPGENEGCVVNGKRDSFFASRDGGQTWCELFYDDQSLLLEEEWAKNNSPWPCVGMVDGKLTVLQPAA